MNNNLYSRRLKRIYDCVFAFLAIIILSPIMSVAALLIRLKLGSPIIFKQERPGYREEIFTLYKFRSMTSKKDENGNLLPDTTRLTSFGMLLRATSLDELPELFNILKGDMSFVGPRPLAKIYLPYYYKNERIRHNVRPGLTGLAQVNGRNSLSWEEKFAFDVKYVSNITFCNDLKILFKTVNKVLDKEGIGQAEQAPESLHIVRKDMKRTDTFDISSP